MSFNYGLSHAKILLVVVSKEKFQYQPKISY